MNYSKNILVGSALIPFALGGVGCASQSAKSDKPMNIVLIYTDDLGYGDIAAYGAKELKTPNLDRLANGGVRFTNGYSSSATSTPSRFALLTGTYPWREKDAKILPGSAPMLIKTETMTLPRMLQDAGYYTGVVGKWHLGLGNGMVDWNSHIYPNPNDVGFDYSFIMAATQDRVPTVYIKDGLVEGLDPKDPIEVSYKKNFKGEATGLANPELTTMKWHHGHNNSIINGIPRIGFMKGGQKARWNDVDMADDMLDEAQMFIDTHKDEPFFLYFAMQQPHVPRTPHPRFVGTSGMGPRGDVILEADWAIGELLKTLEDNNLMDNTLIIFSSDNGPVLNDGYYDEAVEMVGDHLPAGPLRGGKYSLFEAGTRVPFMVYWENTVEPKVSDALVCQMDLMTSLASLVGSDVKGPDSENLMDTFLGKSDVGRDALVLEATSRTALRQGDWVMIPPYRGEKIIETVNIEIGNDQEYQLYNLKDDIGQRNNLAKSNPEKLNSMVETFAEIRGANSGSIQELVLE